MSGQDQADAPIAMQIATAMDAVRGAPQSLGPRMALFQLAAVTGDWKRARTQLDTMAKLDAEAMMLAKLYGRLIDAEAVRANVFAGAERPVALGQPSAWLAMLAQALAHDGAGEGAAARELRRRALEEAPARPGELDGKPFAWVMDADHRLGPLLEVVVEGSYRWLPLTNLVELRAEPPKAMRDLVWQPVTLTLTSGSELAAFVPTRYPGSESSSDDAVRLARTTRWDDRGEGEQQGLGQRLLATDTDDYGLLDVRRLRFTADEAASVG